MTQDIKAFIQDSIKNNKVVLFMKGEKNAPACGFSASVVQILNHLNVDFYAINVLSDDNLRQAVKEFSNWPTFPQLYANQELIGGCDIVKEMFISGELATLLKNLEIIK